MFSSTTTVFASITKSKFLLFLLFSLIYFSTSNIFSYQSCLTSLFTFPIVSTLIDTSYSGGTTPPTTEVNALPFERLSASTREDAYKALVLEIYIDQSMIEAFSSGGMHASTLRVYSSHSDCDAIELFVRESSMDAIAYKEANVPVAVDIHSISSLG